ncbi:MAG: glutathione-dependent formaldehyde dehydrogenase [Acidisphaera sp.]|nr:glutathione-dependent formaldehyde dehydrogenase [Acidisphaera sp.]MBV9812977.1 glutathione-dependent formaldehyde dehydrogenase [Acetobacteraceae bacterium]
MKAVVWHGIGDIRMDDVAEPRIEQPTDAVVRLTRSAICGTDLHFVRGTFSGMKPGTVLGHEGVGVVEKLGDDVRNFEVGDRVVICSTIACGTCSYCRAGYFAQCDRANPNGPDKGTSFFGGPADTGPINGLQAERARIPFAATTMVKLPDEVSDDQAILISDIFPTGWYGAVLAEVTDGDTVAVFGAGPVGQFAIASALMMNAGRVIAVDRLDDRLAMARRQGAFTVNFEREDPVATVKQLTGGVGVDRVIDAVGVDAQHAHGGPAHGDEAKDRQEVQQIAPEAKPRDGTWVPGDAPSQALRWAVESLAKAGTLGIIGVYPPTMQHFPIGMAMNKNLSINAGNCNHRAYVPKLVEMVRMGRIDPTSVLTKTAPLTGAIEAYQHFDRRESGWIKTELTLPQAAE